MMKDTNPVKIDQVIQEGLLAEKNPIVPDNFANRLMHKFELRTFRKNLLEEWILKLAILFAVSVGMGLTFFLANSNIISTFISNYFLITLGVLAIVFIFFFDQVILKLLFYIKESKNRKLN